MSKLDLNEADFLFASQALPEAKLLVYKLEGHEALSEPFSFEVDLVTEESDLDIDAAVGKPACLTLRGRLPDGERYVRYVHGIIERFIQLSAGIRHSRYKALLVPAIKPLAFTRNSRIFQQQSGPDVTLQVLKDGGIGSGSVRRMLHSSYGVRDYCVQYQESDLDFIRRLWEEEGIFYFFEHTRDEGVLQLGDGTHATDTLAHYGEVSYRDQAHLHEEVVFEFAAQSELRPGATVLRDFKFKQPTLDLEATAQTERFSQYKMYFFPGDYVDPALGQRLAKMRLEEQQCQASRFLGTGTVRAMLPGYKFTLSGHRRERCNQEYLVVRVEHRGVQPQALGEEGAGLSGRAYENRIECIPARVMYRPPSRTARPCIAGVQTAVVVGPSGEEIHCDEHGRVKVQFHWDRQGKRDDGSSCWIRVSQPWGGAGQGGMFIPRVGQEVVVQFMEGDPDRPLIIGRVYNGENPVPHGLPAAKNISTIRSSSTPGGGGFNEIKFDDSASSEEIFVHAQKDYNEVVENNHSTQVGTDQANVVGANQLEQIGKNQTMIVGADRQKSIADNESVAVGKNRAESVGINEDLSIGSNQTLTVGANRELTVGANQNTRIGANLTTLIGGSKTTTLAGAHTETISGSMTVSVLQNMTETVAINRAETVGAAMELTVGGAFIESVGGMMQVSVGGVLNETVGVSRSTQVGIAASLNAGQVISQAAGQAVATQAGQVITLSAGQKVAVTAGQEISLQAGAAQIVLKSSGDITIKGTSITIKGSGDVVIKGSKISQN